MVPAPRRAADGCPAAAPLRPRLRWRKPARPWRDRWQPVRPAARRRLGRAAPHWRGRGPHRGRTGNQSVRRSIRRSLRGPAAGRRNRRLLPAIPGRDAVDRRREPEPIMPGKPGCPVPQGYRRQMRRRRPPRWRRSDRSLCDPVRRCGPRWAQRAARTRWWRRPLLRLPWMPPVSSRCSGLLRSPATLPWTFGHPAARLRRRCLDWTRSLGCWKRRSPARIARPERPRHRLRRAPSPRLRAGRTAPAPVALLRRWHWPREPTPRAE